MYYEEYKRRMATAVTGEERQAVEWMFRNSGNMWERMPPLLRYGSAVLVTIYFVGGLLAPLFWTFK